MNIIIFCPESPPVIMVMKRGYNAVHQQKMYLRKCLKYIVHKRCIPISMARKTHKTMQNMHTCKQNIYVFNGKCMQR